MSETTNGHTNSNGHLTPIDNRAKWLGFWLHEAIYAFDSLEEAFAAAEYGMSISDLSRPPRLGPPSQPNMKGALMAIDAGLGDLRDELLLLLPAAGTGGIALGGEEILDSVERYRKRLLSGHPWAGQTVIDVGSGSGTAANIEGHSPAHAKRAGGASKKAKLRTRLQRARARLKRERVKPRRSSAEILKEAFPNLSEEKP
jgi:hypothetical protein